MVEPRVEKAYEKYAWVIFFAIGILFVVSGMIFSVTGTLLSQNFYQSDVTLGMPWSYVTASDPKVGTLSSDIVRIYGEAVTYIGVLITPISLKSFRKGENWSWYTMWSLPVVLAYDLALETSFGLPFSYVASIELPVLVLSVLGLLLPYRKFFPRNR